MVQNVFATSASAENCSRHDLLAFVNNCLQANFTRIEEMSTGAAYCQLTDFLFRGMIQLRKVKWNSRNEVDWISNWRLLQTAWKEIGVEKTVPVERLLKGKFQDNFEFLQWFKKFFDANCTALPYDPIEARNGEPLPASVSTGSAKSATARTTSSVNAKKVAPGNGVESSTRLTAVRGKPVVGSATKSIAASTDSLEIERQRCRRLQAQLEEMTSAISEIEKERNFYFSKLQKVEAYCQNAGEDASVQCEAILQILYEVEEGFAVPTVDERSEQNGTDSVVIATTGEKQMKNDEVSIVDARVKALHLNDSETF
uniref:Uncharacterized protein n=1 Tax=Parascaris univalens TaxID=6257 RepID=A0A915AH43_PARUN